MTNKSEKKHILDVLTELQKGSPDNCLSDELVKKAAEQTGASETAVRELAGFYDMLGCEKRARFVIEVCSSNPCKLCNNAWIAQQIDEELGIYENEVTDDGMFSFKYMNCCGHCAQGPVVRVDGKVYENMTKESLHDLIETLKA